MAWFPSKTRKGRGFRKGEPDKRDHDFSRLGLAAPAPRTTVSLERYAKILDQGPSSTCVGHIYAEALYNREGYVGLEQRDLSVLYPYYWSRWLHGSHRSDSGTFLRTMGEGGRRFGVCDEKWWGFSPLGIKVNRAPNIAARSHSFPRVGAKYVMVLDPHREAVHASLRSALQNGYCPGIGIGVGRSFQRMDGPEIIELHEFVVDLVGGHALLVVGYDAERGLYRLQNSWSKDWRDGGFCWVPEEVIDHAMEIMVMYGWPRLLEAA